MSRRKNHASLARPKLADQRFNSVVVEQLIKMLMISGKKQKANQIVYTALDELYQFCQKKGDIAEANADKDAAEEASEGSATELSSKDAYILRVFNNIIDKAGPSLELKSRRVGGANIQVPITVQQDRKVTLALRFIKECARKKISQCKSMAKALAQELIGIINGNAETLNLRDRMLSMAKANAVFQVVKKG